MGFFQIEAVVEADVDRFLNNFLKVLSSASIFSVFI